jgi:hypothetical protein
MCNSRFLTLPSIELYVLATPYLKLLDLLIMMRLLFSWEPRWLKFTEREHIFPPRSSFPTSTRKCTNVKEHVGIMSVTLLLINVTETGNQKLLQLVN